MRAMCVTRHQVEWSSAGGARSSPCLGALIVCMQPQTFSRARAWASASRRMLVRGVVTYQNALDSLASRRFILTAQHKSTASSQLCDQAPPIEPQAPLTSCTIPARLYTSGSGAAGPAVCV
jgi:hypothetical protein